MDRGYDPPMDLRHFFALSGSAVAAVALAAAAHAAPQMNAPVPESKLVAPIMVPSNQVKPVPPAQAPALVAALTKKPVGGAPAPAPANPPPRVESATTIGAISCAETVRLLLKIRANGVGGPVTLQIALPRGNPFGGEALAVAESVVDIPANETRDVMIDTGLRPTCLSDGTLDPRLLVIGVGGFGNGTPTTQSAFGPAVVVPSRVEIKVVTLGPKSATLSISTALAN